MRYLKVYHVRVMRQGPRGYVRDGRAAECSQIVTYSLQEWNDPFSSFCEALIPKTRANASLTFIWNPSSRNQVNDLTLQIRCFYLVSILLKHCDSGSQLVLSFIFWLFLFLSQNYSLHHVFRICSVIADGVQSGVCRRSKNTWKRAQRVIQTSEWAAANTCDITEPRRDSHGNMLHVIIMIYQILILEPKQQELFHL